MPSADPLNFLGLLTERQRQLFDEFRYGGEALQLWTLLGNAIDTGSSEYFTQWTDHGINHLKSVFINVRELISEEAERVFTSSDVYCLCTSVLLHDIAMRFKEETLDRLIGAETNYPKLRDKWIEFCGEMQHWDDDYIAQTYGPGKKIPLGTDFKQYINDEKFVVGEFLRREHGVIARLLVDSGFAVLAPNDPFVLAYENFPSNFKLLTKLSSYIAESHTKDFRESVVDVKHAFGISGLSPTQTGVLIGANYVYLMTLLRIADFLEFRNSTSQHFLKNSVRLTSPISLLEHATMDAYSETVWDPRAQEVSVRFSTADPAVLFNYEKYEKGIQNQLDVSWALLSEYYANSDRCRVLALFGLTVRRVGIANLSLEDIRKKYHAEPLRISVSDASVIYLLASPLYNADPRFALRELISNSHDAASELSRQRPDARVDRTIYFNFNVRKSSLEFIDSGVGMSISDVSMFFLRVGGRLRSTLDWKKSAVIKKGDLDESYSYASRFGVGVVSLFMLGKEIEVTTKRLDSDGVRLIIRPNFRELVAERWQGQNGTTLRVNAETEIIHQLHKSLFSSTSEKSAGLSHSTGNYSLIAEDSINKFMYLSYYSDVKLSGELLRENVEATFPSLVSQLQGHGLNWVAVEECEALAGANCFLISREERRDISPLGSGSVVVYNGIPVRVNSAYFENTLNGDIMVVEDPFNQLSFNLQKTELSDVPAGLFKALYRSFFLAILTWLYDQEDKTSLIHTRTLPRWTKYSRREVFALVNSESDQSTFGYGLLPMVLLFKKTFISLTSKALRSVREGYVLFLNFDEIDVTDIVKAIPGFIPSIIFVGNFSHRSAFQQAIKIKCEPPVKSTEVRNPANASSHWLETIASKLTKAFSITKTEDRESLDNFLSVLFPIYRSGSVTIFLVRLDELKKAVDRRVEVTEVVWEAPINI